ncbi:MAG: hypothetical protein AB7N65_28670 [Vicinamibacterales bacterium]
MSVSTTQQLSYSKADIPTRVRLAGEVARTIVTRGLGDHPLSHEGDTGVSDASVLTWTWHLAGEELMNLKDPLSGGELLSRLDLVAGSSYALGVAVGLLMRPEAFQHVEPASRQAARS